MRPPAHLTLAQRQSIAALALKNPNVSQLARDYATTRASIKRWLQEGRKPAPDFGDKARSGRPPSTTQLLKNSIRRHAHHHKSLRQIKEATSRRRGFHPSTSTIERVLKSGRSPMHWAPINRGVVLRRANIPKRIAFCRAHLHDSFRSWVFTDAKVLHVGYDPLGMAARCWQEINKPPSPSPVANAFTFHFYAAVAYGHKSSLVFVPPSPAEGSSEHKSSEHFSSKHYISMMEEMGPHVKGWFPGASFHIIQDSAKQHTSQASKKAMSRMGLPMLSDFPAQSWDLNIIENVWGVMVQKLQGVRAKTSSTWRAAIINAWEQVEQSTINKLVDGLHARMQKVLDAEGQWVSHH